MKKDNTKENLILATVKLLSQSEAVTEITARQIVAEANTNLAMINYHFKSKETLINIAIERIIADSANNLKSMSYENFSPKEQLRKMLYDLCNLTVSYSKFTKINLPYILLQAEITQPFDVLPIIKKHFGDKKSDADCRIIAYQMISFMQLIFLRSEDFLRYSGINIFDEEQRNAFIDMQVNLFLGDEN
ncbi:TetR/AcrR family transcriptional regulator [Clostridium sp. 19966]|uniref:TetR/AcrR family transcriptional regulator n=1 Tax=Clostridium sp. 19966 TaxID=2768166 RepID=UPI0028DDCEF6|nr:TetR/AcrR family transcriptional regulator [Clostridium sp. 19966]MDT8717710.1 TetR/AcrR family transcriptional regulator [Clostridium sp. 19966]